MVPILAPKMMPTPAAKLISPADRNEMVITDTSDDDCMIVVVNTPKPSDFSVEPVARASRRSRNPPENSLNPSSSINMPNRKIATPAAIT